MIKSNKLKYRSSNNVISQKNGWFTFSYSLQNYPLPKQFPKFHQRSNYNLLALLSRDCSELLSQLSYHLIQRNLYDTFHLLFKILQTFYPQCRTCIPLMQHMLQISYQGTNHQQLQGNPQNQKSWGRLLYSSFMLLISYKYSIFKSNDVWKNVFIYF